MPNPGGGEALRLLVAPGAQDLIEARLPMDSDSDDSADSDERHAARMRRRKEIVDAGIASAKVERGVLIVYTGQGKGKSSAAFGLLARALGHGLTAGVVQFVKSRSDTGEGAFFSRLPAVQWYVLGEGFTWETEDRQRHAAAARAAWDVARRLLADATIGLVVLDELTYAFTYHWIDLEEVLAVLRSRPPMQHVVITGRGAPQGLVETADTVTDMGLVKHAFQAGVKGMPGVEW